MPVYKPVSALMRAIPGLLSAAAILLCAAAVARGGETLPENRWTKLADCPPDPLGRELQPGRGAFWCFDPASAKFLRYGGYTPTDCNALWTFDLAARKWENPLKADCSWPPKEDRPGAGAWWSMAYDSKRKVIWMHGGFGAAARYRKELYQDIWQYDPAAGTFKAMKSQKWPAGGGRIVYDGKNDLVLRQPADDSSWAVIHNRERTWVYDPNKNAWEGRQTKGSPKAFSCTVWSFDESAGVAVFLAGAGKKQPADTWTYDAAANAWTKLELKESPEARTYAGSCYDPHNKVTIVYGGIGHPGGDKYGFGHRGGGVALSDTWALDLAGKKWLKLDVGAPEIPKLNGEGANPRFPLRQAMDYDTKHKAVVVSAPTFGVWALRYRAGKAEPLPKIEVAAAAAPFDKVEEPKEPVYKQAEPNKKLLGLEPGKWVKLGGGGALGGGEVPMIYDEATGFCLKYGGCNNGGTTFASGYGNDLSAYDPATERWMALRWVDPAGAPRPVNGCTRYYAYDPVRKVDWFVGGTAGNGLASSLPADWPGGSGTWCYDGLKDRFFMVPHSGAAKVGAGVVCCYDRANNLFVVDAKAYAGNAFAFDPAAKAWKAGAPCRAEAYTYGDFCDSLKRLLVIEPGKDGNKLLAYDAAAGKWEEVETKGPTPSGKGRPTAAYDRDNDVFLCVLDGRTWALTLKDKTWKDLGADTKAVEECLVYDTRHKVFLGCGRGGDMHAFRYK